jgi:hypothetical protein
MYFQGITRIHKLGLTLCVSMKLKLLDQAATLSRKHMIQDLQVNPLGKILGDNLDIIIRAIAGNIDLHLFTSIIVFPRIPCLHMSLQPTALTREDVAPEDLVLHDDYMKTLMQSFW